MDESQLRKAADVLAQARHRKARNSDDARRNPSAGNTFRMRESTAYLNGIFNVLDALGVRREVETEAMRHGH